MELISIFVRNTISMLLLFSGWNMNKVLLLDFDGTIIDSESMYFYSWKDVFQQYACTLELNEWCTKIRTKNPDQAAFLLLEEKSNLLFEFDIVRQSQKKIESVYMKRSTVRDGIIDLLDACRDEYHIPVSIVTSSEPQRVMEILKNAGLENRFSYVITDDDVMGVKKPDPAGYFNALLKHNAEPGNVCAIEDSPKGIVAAQSAGIRVIAYPNMVTVTMDITGVDSVVHTGSELLRAFSQFVTCA
jgi:putative hydrolase of the HAD superfamily